MDAKNTGIPGASNRSAPVPGPVSGQPETLDESTDSDPTPDWSQRITSESATKIPYGFAKKHRVLAASEEQGCIQILTDQPAVLSVLNELRRQLGRHLVVHQLPADEFDFLLERAYDAGNTQIMEDLGDELDLSSLEEGLSHTTDLLDSAEGAPVVRLLNFLITKAIHGAVSDIHLESHEKSSRIRFRADGILRDIHHPPSALHSSLVSRLKVMAKLDISEKRLPQDGRISLRVGGRIVDVRVSTFPTQYGERVVLRLLDKQNIRLDLLELGMDQNLYRSFSKLFHSPYGILLVTGPTGSGKTTTLYASLSQLDSVSLNILTIEDPVEYNLDGISQTQVHQKIGLDFAAGLRSILRQDPDVVLVGEIRDHETAEIAVQASMTGHLVLSTLHTNSAIGAVTRLVDIGIEPFLIASSLLGVLAQRLVRCLCMDCREPYQPDIATKRILGLTSNSEQDKILIYRPKGCESCGFQGYQGRLGIYELIELDEEVRSLIYNRASEDELSHCVRKHGGSMMQDGMTKVLQGITSLEEVLRVTQDN